jgi:hypothetical protein
MMKVRILEKIIAWEVVVAQVELHENRVNKRTNRKMLIVLEVALLPVQLRLRVKKNPKKLVRM